MTDHSEAHSFVRTFCEALSSRDASKLRPMLADDVEWTVFGPVDYFPFFGNRKGKEAVIEAMCTPVCRSFASGEFYAGAHAGRRQQGGVAGARDGGAHSERAHAGVPAGAVHQISRWQAVEMRAILDSFDVVEQVLDATQTRVKTSLSGRA